MVALLDKIREKLSLDVLIGWYKREVLKDEYLAPDKAALLFQLGKLEEIFNRDNVEATRYYLLAFKQDPTFALPVISAGSILCSTESFERLLHLYGAAIENVTDPALKSAFIMFLVEALVSMGQDKQAMEYLLDLEGMGKYPVHSLVLQEWQHHVSGSEDNLRQIVEKWKVVSENPYVRSQLCLELARENEKQGNADLARELLREAAYNGRDFFPTMLEIICTGVRRGEFAWLEEMIIDDIDALAQGGDPASRFLLVKPASTEEAAVLLAGFLSTFSAVKSERLTEDTRVRIYETVNAAMSAEKFPDCPPLLIEYARQLSDKEITAQLIEHYLRQPIEPIEKAWLYWNLVKADLQGGRTGKAIESIKEIKNLGFSSSLIDSLVPLLHLSLDERDEMMAYMESISREERQDVVVDAILSDLRWFFRGDLASVAKTLSSYETFSYGMEDIAHVAAIESGDSFLKEKALETKISKEGGDSALSRVERIRLHAFEKPDREKFAAAFLDFTPSSKPLAVWGALVGLWKLFEAGGGEKAASHLRNAAANITSNAFSPFIFNQWARSLLGVSVLEEDKAKIPGDEALRGSLGYHTILSLASRPEGASMVAEWAQEQLSELETSPYSPEFVVHAARSAAKSSDDPELAAKIQKALFASAAVTEHFPNMAMYLALKEGDLEKILGILDQANAAHDVADYDMEHQAPLNTMSALHALFIEKDFSRVIDILAQNLAAGGLHSDSMFLFLFSLPLAMKWEEWVALWSSRKVGPADETQGKYETDVDRACMIAGLALTGETDHANTFAERILSIRKGDPASLVVKLYCELKSNNRKGFTQALRHIGIWMGVSPSRGRVSFHVNLLESMEGREEPRDVGMVMPDIVNMDFNIATVVEGGLINLTADVIASSLAQLGKLPDKAYKSAGLLELGEFLESVEEPKHAMKAFEEALDTDPNDIGAVFGLIRTARALGENMLLARALERLGLMTSDSKKAAEKLVEAGSRYSEAGAKDDRVLGCYKKAFELDPANDKSFLGMTEAIENKGDLPQLISLIERRVGTISEYSELQTLLMKLATLKRKAKDLPGALEAVEDLLLITPESAPDKITALRLKMELLVNLKKVDQAFEVGSQLAAEAKDRKVRRGIIQKCINLAFQKLNVPEKGLAFCIKLIEDGDVDKDFVNKTLRIALKLGRWDEAAEIQDNIAATAATGKERAAALLKKAEIFLRYAKNLEKAEEVYKSILKDDPARWEVLTRWQAARGAKKITGDELARYMDAAYEALRDDPVNLDVINTLIRGNRILMNTTASRYYESLLNVLSGKGAKKIPSPAGMRPSLMLAGRTPAGVLDAEDLGLLYRPDERMKLIADVVRALGNEKMLKLLSKDGLIGAEGEISPEGTSPVLKYVKAWGSVFGIDETPVFRSSVGEDGLLVHPDHADGVTVEALGIMPLTQQASFGLGYNLFCISQGLRLVPMLEEKKLIALIGASIGKFGKFGIEMEDDAGFGEFLSGPAGDAVVLPITSLLESADLLTVEDVEEWYNAAAVGALQAGYLVVGKIEGLIAYARPDIEDLEKMSPEDIAALFGENERLKEVLRFALSRRYELMRAAVGMEL
ncbi:MAG: hypothetical protein ABIJ56_17865 [Pseudomonadota bacterium]